MYKHIREPCCNSNQSPSADGPFRGYTAPSTATAKAHAGPLSAHLSCPGVWANKSGAVDERVKVLCLLLCSFSPRGKCNLSQQQVTLSEPFRELGSLTGRVRHERLFPASVCSTHLHKSLAPVTLFSYTSIRKNILEASGRLHSASEPQK